MNGGGISRSRPLGRGFHELKAVLPQPLVRPREAAVAARRLRPGPPVVAVASGKGGTGKSLLASNLSILASSGGIRTLLLDADLGLANAHLLLDLNPRFHVGDFLEGRCRLRQALVTGPGGVHLLPGSSGARRLSSLTLADLSRIGTELLALASWSEVVVDLPAGLSRATLAILAAARDVLLVTTPDLTAMADAYALVKTTSGSIGAKEYHLVVNRCRSAAEALEVHRRLDGMADRFLSRRIAFAGFLLEDPAIRRSVSRRRPIVLDDPTGGTCLAIRGIRDHLVDAAAADRPGAEHFFRALRRAGH